MRFPEVERILLDCLEELVAAGVSREAAVKATQDAELVAIMDLIQSQKDKRFLDLFDNVGSAALAKRHNKTDRQIRYMRQQAADRLAGKKIGSDTSAQASEKAA